MPYNCLSCHWKRTGRFTVLPEDVCIGRDAANTTIAVDLYADLHNKSSCPRNSHSEFVGAIILMAPTAVSATKRVLPSIHTAVGWEKQAERDTNHPLRPQHLILQLFGSQCKCPVEKAAAEQFENLCSPWTVWQSSDPFLTSLSLSKLARFNLVIPPSLLESATYSWLSSHAKPKGSEVSGSFMTKVTVPLRQAPLLVMATWYTPQAATSETMRRSEPTATRASGFFNSLSRGSSMTTELEHILFSLVQSLEKIWFSCSLVDSNLSLLKCFLKLVYLQFLWIQEHRRAKSFVHYPPVSSVHNEDCAFWHHLAAVGTWILQSPPLDNEVVQEEDGICCCQWRKHCHDHLGRLQCGSPTHLWNSLWRGERFQKWWFAPVVGLCGQLLSALVWWRAARLLRCRKWRIKWHHCYSRLLFCLFWACTNSIKWLKITYSCHFWHDAFIQNKHTCVLDPLL